MRGGPRRLSSLARALLLVLAAWTAAQGQTEDQISPAAESSGPGGGGSATDAATPAAEAPASEAAGQAQPLALQQPLDAAIDTPETRNLTWAQLPASQLCLMQNDTDFYGRDGADLQPSGNRACCKQPLDCCRTCWDTPGCGAWTFRAADSVCWLKQPSGWGVERGMPGLTSGVVTALTRMAYAPVQPGGQRPEGTVVPLKPLEGVKSRTTWQPPPTGYPQGQCMILPNTNLWGEIQSEINNTTADACCDACAANSNCTGWNFCPLAQGCDNGYGDVAPPYACGLRFQNIPEGQISASTLRFWDQGTAVIEGAPYNYTVPFISGYVIQSPGGGGSSSVGAIAGAVVGGIVAVLLAGGLLWFRRRRRQRLQWAKERPDLFDKEVSANMSELDSAWRSKQSPKATTPTDSGGLPGAASLPPVQSGPSGATGLSLGGSSSTIPDLPFASGLLLPTDYKVDTDPSTGKPVVLGGGHFGDVYRGTCGLEPAAIKVIKEPGGEMDRTHLLREAAILKSCKSQFLVSFLGVYMSEHEFVIVTELLPGGTLFNALKAKKVNWYRRGLRIAIDVARGLDYLHRRNIIHLDLKSPNVLLTEHGRAKVADVGLARMVPATQSCLTSNVEMGTFPWAAPEQLFGQRCSTKADIYAYGVVLWEICTQEVPVRGQMREVRVPDECPQAIADLIAACMSGQPEQRPSAEECVDILAPRGAPTSPARAAVTSTQGSGEEHKHDSASSRSSRGRVSTPSVADRAQRAPPQEPESPAAAAVQPAAVRRLPSESPPSPFS